MAPMKCTDGTTERQLHSVKDICDLVQKSKKPMKMKAKPRQLSEYIRVIVCLKFTPSSKE